MDLNPNELLLGEGKTEAKAEAWRAVVAARHAAALRNAAPAATTVHAASTTIRTCWIVAWRTAIV